MVTSKLGLKGKPTIEINVSSAFHNPSIYPDLQSAEEFLAYRMEAYRAAGRPYASENILYRNELDMYNSGESIDWYKLLIRTNAPLIDAQVNAKGGTDDVNYYISGSIINQKGLEVNTDYHRVTLKPNFDLKITDWLKIGDNLLISNSNSKLPPWDGSWRDGGHYEMTPYAKLYENDGRYTLYPMSGDDYLSNIYADHLLNEREIETLRLFNNLYAEIELPISGLKYRLNYGMELSNTSNNNYWPRQTLQGELMKGDATKQQSKYSSQTFENILTYNKTIKENNINITGLYSRQRYRNSSFNAGSTGFISDDFGWNNLSAGALPKQPNSSASGWDLVSYMLRINYNYNSKYYLTATGRIDGYSAFGPNNKYGLFPSTAIAWRLSGEEFLKDTKWLNDLKLRASYGEVGNQAISSYASLARLTNYGVLFDKTSINGLVLSTMQNTNLRWETTQSTNFAVDFSVLKQRISGTIEYYNSFTKDLLLQRQIPEMTGFTSIWDNIGKTRNRGMEVQVFVNPVSRDNFRWDIDFSFSANDNKIIDLYGDSKDDIGNNWFIGQPLGVFYDQKFLGIWQTEEINIIPSSAQPDARPGDPKLEDFSGPDGVPDNRIDGYDRQILGYSDPKWIGGITNTLSYKGITLSVFVYTMQNFEKRVILSNIEGRFRNYDINYWTPENPSNEYPRPQLANLKSYGSMNLFDASFFRVKNINLSYYFPERIIQRVGLNSLSIYMSMRDYFLFTKFPFNDPEISAGKTYPLNKSIEFGLKLSL